MAAGSQVYSHRQHGAQAQGLLGLRVHSPPLPHRSLKASSTSQRQLTPLPTKPLPVSSPDHKAVCRGRSALPAPRRRLPQTCARSAQSGPALLGPHLPCGENHQCAVHTSLRLLRGTLSLQNYQAQPRCPATGDRESPPGWLMSQRLGMRSPATALTNRGGTLGRQNFP